MNMNDETVTRMGVVGLGVVGGTLSRAFREAGVAVRGYDSYQGVGRPEHLQGCPVVFLCVPTPSGADGGYDLTELWNAMHSIEPHLGSGTVVVVKSTVPPGTSDRLSAAFPGLTFASMPEFLVADRPAETLTRPDRIVIGCRSARTARILADLMGRIAPTAPVIHLRPTEAELVKLASNAMLSAKVAEVCDRFGVDWSRVQPGVGLHRRIGLDHLTVSPERGFGGTCLPKDLDGLIAASTAAGYRPAVLEEVASFNRRIRRAAALQSVS
jgi:UDPglucose 6-dehydrogenase